MSNAAALFHRSLRLVIVFAFLLAGLAVPGQPVGAAPARQDPLPQDPAPPDPDGLPGGLAPAIQAALAPSGTAGPSYTFQPNTDDDYQGFSVAVSDSGVYAVVGAYGVDANGQDGAGAAYVFYFDGANWALQARLDLGDEAQAGGRFGIAVDIDSPGSLVLIGEDMRDVPPNTDTGAAHIFRRTGTQWEKVSTLYRNFSGPNDRYGWAVALNQFGQLAYVGAYNATVDGKEKAGKVYLYTNFDFNGNTWDLRGTLAPGAANDYFGYALSRGENNNILVGSPGYNNGAGRASLYHYAGGGGPTWDLVQHLTPNDPAAGDWFGRSAAINTNLNRLVVGASRADVGGRVDQGAAYVFTDMGGPWAQISKLVDASGAAGDNFGTAVGIDGLGNFILVGAPDAAGSHGQSGAAVLFHLVSGAWQATRLDVCPAGGDRCGVSVAIDGGALGGTILLGADRVDESPYLNRGAAFAVKYDPQGAFDPPRRLSAPGWMEWVGAALAISGDGQTALVGVPEFYTGPDSRGRIFIYVRSGINWRLQARLSGPNPAAYEIGRALALSQDGSTALVGDPHAGAVYIYTRVGENWSLQHTLASPAADQGDFGAALALSNNGSVAVVGAPMEGVDQVLDHGAAYVFQRSGTTWYQRSRLATNPVQRMAHFGAAVAVSGSGGTVLVGAPQTDGPAGVDQGLAYTFTHWPVGLSWVAHSTLAASNAAATRSFGAAVALSDDGQTALVGAPGGSLSYAGEAYIFTYTSPLQAPDLQTPEAQAQAAAWTEFDHLTLPASEPNQDEALFGTAVALNEDGRVALVSAPRRGSEVLNDVPGGVLPYLRSAAGYQPQVWLTRSQRWHYGSTLALDERGNTVLVGSRMSTLSQGTDPGGAFAYNNLAFVKVVYLPVAARR